MEKELKSKMITAPRKRERPTHEMGPELVKEVDGDQSNTQTDVNISIMFKIVSDLQEVQLDQLILNRKSFSQTIENLCALSSLVNDGCVSIQFGKNNVQYVVPKNAPTHEERVSKAIVNTQFVFRLDFKCWLLMSEMVPEGEELMPNRAHGETQTQNLPAGRTSFQNNSQDGVRETAIVDAPSESNEFDVVGHSKKLKKSICSSIFPK